MTTRSMFPILALLVFASHTRDAMAATRTTSQSGNWSASATWGGNPPPIAGDNVIVNGNFTVTIDVANAACQTLQLGGSTLGTGAGTITFASGSQLTVAGPVTLGVTNNTPGSVNMTAGGTLSCEGLIDTRLGTWTPGTGTVVFTATNSIPSNNNIDFNHLTVSSGTTTVTRNVTIAGNLVINAGASLVDGASTITCDGNWTNNGAFTGGTGLVTFARNGNQTVSGTGANNFNLIRANLGASRTNVLEIASSQFSAAPGFLQLSAGTFKLSGTFPFTNTLIAGPAYSIPVNAGVWLNNPNASVTAQDGPVTVVGVLRVSAGSYGVGILADSSLVYQNTGSAITIEGGSLTIAGRLCGNNATATTSYTQSGGIVTVVAQGSTDATFAGFDLHAAGSSFTMSGGTIVVRNATGAAADYLNNATASVAGGTLQIGDALSGTAQTIRLSTTRPVGALAISGATAAPVKPIARLTASLTVVGGVTIDPGATLDAAGSNLTLGGNWVDNGTWTNGNTVTFSGAGAQAVSASAGETFVNLTVSKPGGTLTLNSPVTVAGAASFTQGVTSIGTQTLTLDGVVNGGGSLTSAATGTVQYAQGSDGQNVLSGTYGNLAFSDFGKTLATDGVIGVSGAFTPGASNAHVTTGSTLGFTGGAQSIPVFPYHHLTLSGAGPKTAAGGLAIAGNLTNGAGITFSVAPMLTLGGAAGANEGTLVAQTLSVGAAGMLTNDGTLTVATSLEGAGTLAQGPGGVLDLAGAVAIGTLAAGAVGNTVRYSGAGQVVVLIVYHHLTLAGSGAPSMSGVATVHGTFTVGGSVSAAAGAGMSVGGDWVIGAGASFDLANFAHTLQGNWSNAGTVSTGASSLTLNGATPQTVSGGSFHDLSIDNPAGVSLATDQTIPGALGLTHGALAIGAHALTLGGDVTVGAGTMTGGTASQLIVNGSGAATLPALTLASLTLDRTTGATLEGDLTLQGSLAIQNGTLTTGAHTVFMGAAATLAEQPGQRVLGAVQTTRTIAATTGTESFGNLGADIVLNGVALGVTTVLRTTGSVSSGAGHSSIARAFDITPATNSHLNATLVFHYDAAELGAQDPAALELYRSRDAGTSWNDLGGIASAPARTVTVSGLDGFSRWTAADTSNPLGPAPTPSLASITPSLKTVGDPGFTLTVVGSEFVNGKSVVRLNGADRPTTFVSAGVLTAAIPASDLQAVGSVPVTVGNVGGGASNALTLTVGTQAAAKVVVETAADGTGAPVAAQSLVAGSAITVYAIARDPLGNFVANVAATSWTLINTTGGLAQGDLAPAPNAKSAVFSAHLVGTGSIRAASGSLTPVPSGTLTVTPGTATSLRVETAADGSGSVLPAQILAPGRSLNVFAIARDAQNNFLGNLAAAAWALTNVTGGVVTTDLTVAPGAKSAVLLGHASGTCNIVAFSATLAAIGSGTITVQPVADVTEGRPLRLALEQNRPNPFVGATWVSFEVPRATFVRLSVFDLAGRRVATLTEGWVVAGRHTVGWSAAHVESGTYFLRLECDNHQLMRKAEVTR